MRFAFIHVEKASYPIGALCTVLDVSRSGYYAWATRSESAHDKDDAQLAVEISATHERSRGTYGSPRVHRDLRARGIRVGKKRVARLMKAEGLQGACFRKWITTTVRDGDAQPSADLVQRQFSADAPNKLWVADITYIPTWAGFLYLAVVLDAYSRRIVGWSMAEHLRTELVLAARVAVLSDFLDRAIRSSLSASVRSG